MSQRWPPLHRRASRLKSMAALRHTGLRYGVWKHTGKVDRSLIGGEVETRLHRTSSSERAFSSTIVGDLCTMPYCLKHLGPAPNLGTGTGLGPRSFGPENGALGHYLSAKRHLRCQRIGGKCGRFNFDLVAKKGGRALYYIGSRYVINPRDLHIKHLRPFFFHGLSNLATCKFPVWGLDSTRSFARLSDSGPQAQCRSTSSEAASVDENGSYTTSSMSVLAEEVVWKETNTFAVGSLDGVEHISERVYVQEASWTGPGSAANGVDEASVALQSDPTLIVFDIETTGFLKSGTKIVELACRDLAGGERSTFETLVNPHQPVPIASTGIHKITSEMVNRDDIPSWTEVMTAFVDFVESRRNGDGQVILIAHNGRKFDVPFIMKECHDCAMDIPSDWYFVDTIDLAKMMLRKRFGKIKFYNLQYLYYDCYNLPRLKDAHRAGVDVDMLASVFGKLLMDLELPVTELLNQAFKAEDIELKPDLLVREDNDRYTSFAREVDAGLLDQSIVDGTELELALDIESQVQIKEDKCPEMPILAAVVQVSKKEVVDLSLDSEIELTIKLRAQAHEMEAPQSEELLVLSTGSAATLTNTVTTEYPEGMHQPQVKEDRGLKTSVYIDDPSTEGSDSGGEKMFQVGNQPDLTEDHLFEAPISARTDEELLGLTRGAAALGGAMSPWEKKIAPKSSQESHGDEYEDALGLVLGNSGSQAISTNFLPGADEVGYETSSTTSLSLSNAPSLQKLRVSRNSDQVEAGTSTSSPVTFGNNTRQNVGFPEAVGPVETSDKDGTVGLLSLESVDEGRPLSQAAGDGTLQPLNLGGTLLKKKKGKRRGTGDVQTTAIKNIAQTVADCEEQLSVAESAVLEIRYLNTDSDAVRPVLEQNISGTQHPLQAEKNDTVKEKLHTSSVNLSLLSPMMKQYVETKRQRPKFLLLSRVGDFYEAFFEDAERLAHACNIRLSAVDGGKLLERKVPMAGVPYHKVDVYLRNLLGKGIAVVKQDQVTAANAKGGTIIERQVTAVLTPGTLLDEGMLEESCNNFLVAIFPHADENGSWGLAYSDISTGEFQATQGQGRSALLHELLRLQPSEVIFPANVACVADRTTGVLQPSGMPPGLCYSSRPTSEFFPGAAEKRLQSSFGEESLETFGLLRSSHAIRAAGGLLGYVQETQKLINEEIPLQKPSYYSALETMHMDDTVRSHLELLKTSRWGKLEGSLVWALDHTQTAMGGRLLRRWLLWPLINYDHICTRQDAVEVFVRNHDLRAEFRSELAGVADMERLAARIAWKRADARDLLTLAQSVQTLPNLAAIIEGASSNPYFLAASQTPTLAVQWARKVEAMLVEELGSGAQAGRVIKEGVDSSLDELQREVRESKSWLEEFEKQERKRTGIPSLEVGYNKNMGHYISIRKSKLKEDAIPDDYQRLQSLKSEERFVTPPLLQCETSRLATEVKVQEREDELLRSLKEEMVGLLEPVREYTQALAALDVLATFADLAVKRDYCRPHMLEMGREITIIGGRHPVVEISLPEDSVFVPNSVYLGYESVLEKASVTEFMGSAEVSNESELREALTGESEKWWPRADLVVLTGPNASGKSCYLRQLGLIQLLAQAGSFIPAKFAQLSVADGLYTRVGAVDDLAAGQSTFRIEMVESANILNRSTAHSLILLDEVGRGTGSQEGAVIARAIIEYLSQRVRTRTIFSTHYHNLHVLDQEFPNVANYYFEATELENGEVMFDHAVMPGYAVKSHAIAIGRGAGLPEWVCNRAAELLALEEEGSAPSEMCPTGRAENSAMESRPDETEPEEDGRPTEVHETVDLEALDVAKPESGRSSAEPATALHEGSSEDRLLQESSDSALDESGQIDGAVFARDSATEIPTAKAFTGQDSDAAGSPKPEERSNDPVQESSSLAAMATSSGPQDLDHERRRDADVNGDAAPVGPGGAAEEANGEERWGDKWSTREQLDEVWEHVCAALQNQPATQALSRQKGSLVSVQPLSDEIRVCMGAPSLFVRKFQQPEHAAALESAFVSVLHRPIQLRISVLPTAHSPPR